MNADFVKAYNADFKRNPDFFSIGAWDGMHLIYEALKKTNGNTDGEALINAAKGMKWESPRGPISIDPDTRDIMQNVYMRKVEKVDGKLVNVEIDTLPEREGPGEECARRRRRSSARSRREVSCSLPPCGGGPGEGEQPARLLVATRPSRRACAPATSPRKRGR